MSKLQFFVGNEQSSADSLFRKGNTYLHYTFALPINVRRDTQTDNVKIFVSLQLWPIICTGETHTVYQETNHIKYTRQCTPWVYVENAKISVHVESPHNLNKKFSESVVADLH